MLYSKPFPHYSVIDFNFYFYAYALFFFAFTTNFVSLLFTVYHASCVWQLLLKTFMMTMMRRRDATDKPARKFRRCYEVTLYRSTVYTASR